VSDWDVPVSGADLRRGWDERRLARTQADIASLREELEVLSDPSRRYDELVAEKRRLLELVSEARMREATAEKELEQQQRELDAVLKRRQRQAERARLRHHEEPGIGSRRSAHVWVDPEAWAVIKRVGLERWKSAAEMLTEIVEADAANTQDTDLEPRGDNRRRGRRRRSPGEGDPVPQHRVMRLDCDDECWHQIRLAADTAGSTVGRYVGQLIETAAHEHGWRAPVSGPEFAIS